MECELCGRGGALVKVEIEGAVLSVCSSCAKLGRAAELKVELPERRPLTDCSVINPDFAKIIRNARIKQDLSIEQLGGKIGEKTSVLERVERGMRPTDGLAKKLEKALKIKLLGYQEE